MEVAGQIDGEMHCTSLSVSRKAKISGTIEAEKVVVDGRVEGPIQSVEVVLKSDAHVVGDIRCQSLVVEKGAFMEGRMMRTGKANGHEPAAVQHISARDDSSARESLVEAESSTREAELTIEARHLSGNPDLPTDEAIVYLAEGGHPQAQALMRRGKYGKGRNSKAEEN